MTWARIWYAMCAHVQERNPWQHPTMIGNPARAVFGGPPVTGDAGFTVTRTGTGYRIGAGTLAGVTEEAELADRAIAPGRAGQAPEHARRPARAARRALDDR